MAALHAADKVLESIALAGWVVAYPAVRQQLEHQIIDGISRGEYPLLKALSNEGRLMIHELSVSSGRSVVPLISCAESFSTAVSSSTGASEACRTEYEFRAHLKAEKDKRKAAEDKLQSLVENKATELKLMERLYEDAKESAANAKENAANAKESADKLVEATEARAVAAEARAVAAEARASACRRRPAADVAAELRAENARLNAKLKKFKAERQAPRG